MQSAHGWPNDTQPSNYPTPSAVARSSGADMYFISIVSSVKLFTPRILSFPSDCSKCKNRDGWGLGRRMTSFKMLSSIHSCTAVQEGEENVKRGGKQYPVVGIQILFRALLESRGSGVSRRWLQFGSVYIKPRGPSSFQQGGLIARAVTAGLCIREPLRPPYRSTAKKFYFTVLSLWTLHSSWYCSFNKHGNHYSEHSHAPDNNNKRPRMNM